jgi:hypothetical protein
MPYILFVHDKNQDIQKVLKYLYRKMSLPLLNSKDEYLSFNKMSGMEPSHKLQLVVSNTLHSFFDRYPQQDSS